MNRRSTSKVTYHHRRAPELNFTYLSVFAFACGIRFKDSQVMARKWPPYGYDVEPNSLGVDWAKATVAGEVVCISRQIAERI